MPDPNEDDNAAALVCESCAIISKEAVISSPADPEIFIDATLQPKKISFELLIPVPLCSAIDKDGTVPSAVGI